MTQAEKTNTVPFRGRDIEVRPLLPAQDLLMLKIARGLRGLKVDEPGPGLLEAAKILEILESALVKPDDVEFIEELIIKRDLDLKEVIYLVAGKDPEQVDQKPKVRRGRPPKRPAA
jgi:hypothetical protein